MVLTSELVLGKLAKITHNEELCLLSIFIRQGCPNTSLKRYGNFTLLEIALLTETSKVHLLSWIYKLLIYRL
jgi:hypothetical protein